MRKPAKSDFLKITGIDCHIGSQITDISPFLDACDKLLDLADVLKSKGIELDHIDFGGGLGIVYEEGQEVHHASELVEALHQKMENRGYGYLEMIFEAGRSIVGNSGVLVTEIQYLQGRRNEELLHCRYRNERHDPSNVVPSLDADLLRYTSILKIVLSKKKSLM